ncbi:hypothetical protein CLV49_0991 [Labedella gwakjiensis]|uniref:Uncharacterized protein n=1 Tax=Labedella gwakjiensis TaxID=390269 RepID=A0A2P8GTU3_9MICO|nr:hypothetical protein [Labedella gwakjiensis]PSL37384.1 hypothetical protein CLV49_0991 [Labedella gwakjiensis]RUQ84703.1 hypothetical protein ELQ93_13990 [Labedella gwakjiensis]
MTRRPRPAARAAVFGALAAVVVTVLLFPFVSGGWCADATDPDASVCGTFQRSIVGIDTSIWFWLGGLAVVGFFTVLAINRTATGQPPTS